MLYLFIFLNKLAYINTKKDYIHFFAFSTHYKKLVMQIYTSILIRVKTSKNISSYIKNGIAQENPAITFKRQWFSEISKKLIDVLLYIASIYLYKNFF